MQVRLSDEIRKAAPGLQVLYIEANISNPPTSDELWQELTTVSERMRQSYEMDMINKRPAIAATRSAYKACGKEPNRYRPSSEALCRRMVKGLELYRSLTVIDLINLLSVATGHSIGGFDADKIVGGTLTIGIGREGEPYEAIGRGPLNVAGLPILRDDLGGIGTPTSDHERTKLSEQTHRLLMVVNMYGEEMPLDDVKILTCRLLEQYAHATDIKMQLCNS
jgi:DNA/RNA-binding domain of Phe-tRNA-synthetase-like protein